jgi:hypothetical protein
MPRKKLLRRFDPFGGVSQPMVEAEAKYLAREIDNKSLLSRNDVAGECCHRHQLCRQSWEHLQQVIAGTGEREKAVVQSLLFRDLYHIVALYVFHLQAARTEGSTAPASPVLNSEPVEFKEWLFDPKL